MPYVSREDLTAEEREVFDEFERERGTAPGHIHRAIANAPNLLRRFSAMAMELRNHTNLDPRLRELALMTVRAYRRRRVRIRPSLEYRA